MCSFFVFTCSEIQQKIKQEFIYITNWQNKDTYRWESVTLTLCRIYFSVISSTGILAGSLVNWKARENNFNERNYFECYLNREITFFFLLISSKSYNMNNFKSSGIWTWITINSWYSSSCKIRKWIDIEIAVARRWSIVHIGLQEYKRFLSFYVKSNLAYQI